MCDVKHNMRCAIIGSLIAWEHAVGLSKTQQGLKLVAEGVPVRQAAEQAGIAESTLRMAIGRTKGRNICPCCGQVVREGFEVDPGKVAGG